MPHQLEPTQANSVAKASPFLHDHQSPVRGLVSLNSGLIEKLWVNCFSLWVLGGSGNTKGRELVFSLPHLQDQRGTQVGLPW